MTSKTYTATNGPLTVDVISHVGQVLVTVDPAAAAVEATISTTDTEGPVADAVLGATFTERAGELAIRVPRIHGLGLGGGGTTTLQMGGNTFTFSGSSGVSMIGNDIYVGGHKVVANGQVVAQQGTRVGGAGGTVRVELRVPALSSVQLDTTSADLLVRGDLKTLEANTVSGDVEAQGVHTLRVDSTSGDIEVERVENRADLHTISGDIDLGAYDGSELRAESVSGDILISATPTATGRFRASTVSGDITTRGAAHLNPRISTISGRKRIG